MSNNELNQLTQILEIEDQIQKKYQEYANVCTNLSLKQTCQKVESRHKNHFNKLLSLFNK